MEQANVEDKLKKVAYFLGTIQGLAYTGLALACVIVHYEGINSPSEYSYMKLVGLGMYEEFLNRENALVYSLRPKVFIGLAFVYFFSHVAWMLLSLAGFFTKRKHETTNATVWSFLTLFICLWDFITVVILGSDYQKCLDQAQKDVITEGVCATIILPTLVIAAKGFTLWVVNLVFAIILYKIASNLKKNAPVAIRAAPPLLQPQQSNYQSGPAFQTAQQYPQSSQQYPQSPQQYAQSPQQYAQSAPQSDPLFAQYQQYPQQRQSFTPQPTPYPQKGFQLQAPPKPSSMKSSPRDPRQFEYPGHIPEPDYNYQHHQRMGRRY